MGFRCTAILLSFLIFTEPSFARPPHARPQKIDSSYSLALAAANRFLHAWQMQDHEAGIMMLSDAARQHVSPEKLQDFFSPGEHAAYEIQPGKRLNGGEYAFPVVLFGVSQNSAPHACTLVIIKVGRNEWTVNRVP